MSSEKENTYAITARAKKVAAMVEAIDRAAVSRGMCPFEDAAKILSSLEKYTEESWKVVDRVAKLKHKSSHDTQTEVLNKFKERAANAPF